MSKRTPEQLAELRALRELSRPIGERFCKHCGCWEFDACMEDDCKFCGVDPCSWVTADECSACRPDLVGVPPENIPGDAERWTGGQRER